VAAKQSKVLVGPDEGTRLPFLDMVYKVTAEGSGGSLTVEEWGLPTGVMIRSIEGARIVTQAIHHTVEQN
jgi:hypothetical protein